MNEGMIDVSGKRPTRRTARAAVFVRLDLETLKKVEENRIPKGDVLGTARTAAVIAAKNTSGLIPLCHNIPLDKVEVGFSSSAEGVRVEASVSAEARTGVEMEALTACAAAALTVYDMCKMFDKGIVITDLGLLEKTGGRSGDYARW